MYSDNLTVLPQWLDLILKITSFFEPFSALRTSFPVLQLADVLLPLFKLTKPEPVWILILLPVSLMIFMFDASADKGIKAATQAILVRVFIVTSKCND